MLRHTGSLTAVASAARDVVAGGETATPEREADAAADDRCGGTAGARPGCADDDRRPDERRDRVEPLPQHDGDLADEDVAHDAAPDAGDRAENHGRGRTDAVVERCARTGDAEEREARGVQQIDRAA